MKKTNLLNVNVNGNKKLVNNDKVRYIIWNLPAIKTCPFATEHCKKACYACKAERMYPSVTPSREKNYNDSLKDDFSVRMIETIAYYREGGFPKLWEFFKWDIENDAEANECSLEIVRQFMMFGRVDLSALRKDGKTLIIEVIPTGE